MAVNKRATQAVFDFRKQFELLNSKYPSLKFPQVYRDLKSLTSRIHEVRKQTEKGPATVSRKPFSPR